MTIPLPRKTVLALYRAQAWILFVSIIMSSSAMGGDNKLKYLTPTSVNVSALLPTPVAPTTPENQRELAAMATIQNTRSPEDCNRAAAEVEVSLASFFGPAGGGPLTIDEVAKLSDMFASVIPEVRYFSNQGKTLWHRARPYDEDSTLTPCIAKEATFSYPSGHAAVSRAFADILVTLYPERWLALMTRADQVPTPAA